LLLTAIAIGAHKLELHIRTKIKRRKIDLDEKLSIEEKQEKIKELEIKTAKDNSIRLGCLIIELICIIAGLALCSAAVSGVTDVLKIFETPG